jgi:hypothetical protein
MTTERGASGTGQRGALATGLRTLELLVASHDPLGVTEIADQLKLDKANAHRTLAGGWGRRRLLPRIPLG